MQTYLLFHLQKVCSAMSSFRQISNHRCSIPRLPQGEGDLLRC